MDGFPQVATYVLVALAVYFLILPPFVAFAGLRLNRQPEVLQFELDSDEMPRSMLERAFDNSEQLKECGFESLGGIVLPDAVPTVRVIGEFFVNRREKVEANVLVFFGDGPLWTINKRYVEFISGFDSSELRELCTIDMGEYGSFPDAPDTLHFRLPGVADVEELWNCHLKLVDRHAGGLRRFLRVSEEFGDDPALRMAVSLPEDYERQVANGYLRLSGNGEYYGPTFVGSYLIVWKELWPIKGIRNAMLRAKGRRLLNELTQSFD